MKGSPFIINCDICLIRGRKAYFDKRLECAAPKLWSKYQQLCVIWKQTRLTIRHTSNPGLVQYVDPHCNCYLLKRASTRIIVFSWRWSGFVAGLDIRVIMCVESPLNCCLRLIFFVLLRSLWWGTRPNSVFEFSDLSKSLNLLSPKWLSANSTESPSNAIYAPTCSHM